MGEGVLKTATAPRALGFAGSSAGLSCESVPLSVIAADAGTPVYVYSAAVIREQYSRLDRAFARVPHRLHYSVKANGNLALLRLLRTLGAGVDIVSAGELHRALLAGFSGPDIVFSGVGKTEAELVAAVDARVRLINVESLGELHLLDEVARRLGRRADIALRVNPEVTVSTPHAYIRTGGRGDKFGVPWDDALDVARVALRLPGVRLVGLDVHIGSMVARVEPYRDAVRRLLGLASDLRKHGASDLAVLDLGGGFAVSYGSDEVEVDPDALAQAVEEELADSGFALVLEPGRFLVGNAGVLLTRVLYRKRSGDKEYVITDAGMTDLLRPSHYDAFHAIDAVVPSGARIRADVVGPVCESGDFLARDRDLDDAAPGDLLIVRSAGAYGYAMASHYNARPKPAEVLVDGDSFAIATRRETVADLVRQEAHELDWRRV